MDASKKAIIQIHLEKCKEALEANGMKVFIADDKIQAQQYVNELILDHTLVCDGGTRTLAETGIIDLLKKRDIIYRTHNDTSMTREESDEEARKAFLADTFLCSSNAITLDGSLINVDGHGNRVSAMIFGPKQVIVVAGYNKIVADEDAAKERIRMLAAPMNSTRLQKQTPCRTLGRCMDCHSKDRICCSYVKINYDREDRIRVILIAEEYGY